VQVQTHRSYAPTLRRERHGFGAGGEEDAQKEAKQHDETNRARRRRSGRQVSISHLPHSASLIAHTRLTLSFLSYQRRRERGRADRRVALRGDCQEGRRAERDVSVVGIAGLVQPALFNGRGSEGTRGGVVSFERVLLQPERVAARRREGNHEGAFETVLARRKQVRGHGRHNRGRQRVRCRHRRAFVHGVRSRGTHGVRGPLGGASEGERREAASGRRAHRDSPPENGHVVLRRGLAELEGPF
jgi:hypothetical protein